MIQREQIRHERLEPRLIDGNRSNERLEVTSLKSVHGHQEEVGDTYQAVYVGDRKTAKSIPICGVEY